MVYPPVMGSFLRQKSLLNYNIMDELTLMKYMETAMNNSYDIITNNKTMEELIVENGISELVFAHNIKITPNEIDIKNMVQYFSRYENFEKCAILSKML